MEKNDIIIIHGTDYESVAKRVLEQTGVAADVGDVNKKVALKLSLVTAEVPPSGTTTHSELLAGVIEYLREHGFQNITVIEESWVDDHAKDAFQTTGYHRVYSRYNVPFVNLQHDTWKEYDATGMKIKPCNRIAAVDYIINTPVLEGHCQTTVTCALKNDKGVVPNSEKRRFHTLGLHRPITHLNTIARSDSILVDSICGDSDSEKGDDSVVMNHVLDFKDPVLCDAFICDCMGYSVDDAPYIAVAEKLGMGGTDTAHVNMIYLNQTTEADSKFRVTRRVQHLATYAVPENVCDACYGPLIHTLDRLNNMGHLRRGLSPIYIGQSYRGQDGVIDVGQCTSCSVKVLGGCPPKAADTVDFLSTQRK